MVFRAALRAADGVDGQPKTLKAAPLQHVQGQGDDLGVDGGVLRAEDLDPVLVELRQRVKNKLLKRTEIKTTYRTLRMKIDILNLQWRTVTTPSGLTVYVAEAV